MRKISKNQKGFTLAEEVVTVLLVGVLVASASGILLNAMRIFCQNVITLTAQAKGIAVMQQLEENLEYANEIDKVALTGTDFPSSTTCAYQVKLWMGQDAAGKNVLNSTSSLKYSSNQAASISENQLCKLGTYDAAYTIKIDGSYAEIQLNIQRNGNTYYSEYRTVELKNMTGASFSYNSEDDGGLYVGSLE